MCDFTLRCTDLRKDKAMRIVTLVFVALFVASCGARTTDPSEQNTSTYEPSYPADYETQIKKHLLARLKDPDSVQGLTVTEPKIGLLNYGAFRKGPEGKTFGNRHYYACVKYNAKNSFGGYVGYQTHTYFFDATGSTIQQVFESGYSDDFWKYDCNS